MLLHGLEVLQHDPNKGLEIALLAALERRRELADQVPPEILAHKLLQQGIFVGKVGVERPAVYIGPLSDIAALGLPATILRPAGFMDDLVGPFYGVPDGRFAVPFTPEALVQFIAVDDIGAFAALAFAEPTCAIGRTIELASTALTSPQIAAAISRAVGRPIPYVQIPIEVIRQQSEDVARVCEWLNEGRYRVDIAPLWALHPAMRDFETWLATDGVAKLQAAGR